MARPRKPERAPSTYRRDVSHILDLVRAQIDREGLTMAQVRATYPSMIGDTWRQLRRGEDFRFSLKFAHGLAEAVGVDLPSAYAGVRLPPSRPSATA